MGTDSVYIIGDGHKVCQDYARSSGTKLEEYAVLSDGCSSSPDTDIGARLLTLSACNHFKQFGSIRVLDDVRSIIARAQDKARLLGIGAHNPLDATLLGIYTDDDYAHAFCVGDGVIAEKQKDGRIVIYSVEAPSGYPVYPSYLLDKSRLESVYAQRLDDEPVWKMRVLYSNDDYKGDPIGGWHMEEIDIFHTNFHRRITTDIAVFSDGITSFTDENNDPVPVQDIVTELLGFKNYTGEFAQRRMQAFLRKAKRRGWKHFDDLSMAAMHVE